MTSLPRPAVCLVTDRRRLAPGARTVDEELLALERFLDATVEAGVDVIQIRERDIDAARLAQLTARTVARAASRRTRVVVNDRADVALAAGAHGVHLPAGGLPAGGVRALRGDWLIGRSVHLGDEPSGDIDYILFGTVFPSASKPEGWAVAGLEGLRAVAVQSPVPVLAIGGVTPEVAGVCLRAGAAGAAAIGVFLPEGLAPGALGVARAVREFRAAFAAART